MVTVKQLENQRIKEIKSLNENEVKSYIDNLVKQEFMAFICYNTDMESYVKKVEEVTEILGHKYNNLNSYVCNVRLNTSLDVFFYNEIIDIIVGATKQYKDFIDTVSRLSDNLFNLEELLKATYRTYNEFKGLDNIESILTGFTSSIESFYDICINDLKHLKAVLINKIDNTDYEDFIVTMNDFRNVLSDNSFFDIGNLDERISNFIKLLEMIQEFKTKNHYHNILDYYSEKFDESRNPLEPFSLLSYYEYDSPDESFDDFMKNELKFDFKTCSFIYP